MSDYGDYNEHRTKKQRVSTGKVIAGAVGLGLAGIGGLLASRYHVCKPEQIMVRTGAFIDNMAVSKRGIQWPFQKVSMITLAPSTQSFDLHNMSKEKVEFRLPISITTRPIHPDEDIEGFKNYARFLNDVPYEDFVDTLKGIVEGEMRVHTATMTIEDMFSNKESFQKYVVDKISVDLNSLGVKILNANIKEMSDFDNNNKFFEYRKKRAIEMANYDSQKDVAFAQKEGEIGIKKHETERRIRKAELEKESQVAENVRDGEIAQSTAKLG